jgi:type IV pilus assembly protein PilM
MTLPRPISRLLQDPPPALAFEISEAGVAAARIGKKAEISFQPLKPGTLSVSPLHDNVIMPDELAAAVRTLAPPNGSRKRREAVLILPEFCTRTAVLDFDEFPADAKEQISLIRFRMKRSVPFDIENAAVSYWPQPAGGKKFDVVVAVSPLEIIARYEAPFRAAGMNPGLVTTSALAALQLVNEPGFAVMAKLNGRVLSMLVTAGNAVKLARSLELPSRSLEDIASDLYPTFVFVEDNLAAPAQKLLLCGFGDLTLSAQERFQRELGVDVDVVRTRSGAADEADAGLMGYLQGLGVLQ